MPVCGARPRTNLHLLEGSPGLSVLPDQADEGVDLGSGDVFLQQLAVVVEQGCDGVLSQHVVAYLLLHETELLGYVLLRDRQNGKVSVKHRTILYTILFTI